MTAGQCWAEFMSVRSGVRRILKRRSATDTFRREFARRCLEINNAFSRFTVPIVVCDQPAPDDIVADLANLGDWLATQHPALWRYAMIVA